MWIKFCILQLTYYWLIDHKIVIFSIHKCAQYNKQNSTQYSIYMYCIRKWSYEIKVLYLSLLHNNVNSLHGIISWPYIQSTLPKSTLPKSTLRLSQHFSKVQRVPVDSLFLFMLVNICLSQHFSTGLFDVDLGEVDCIRNAQKYNVLIYLAACSLPSTLSCLDN